MKHRFRPAHFLLAVFFPVLSNAAITSTQTPPPDGFAVLRERPDTILVETGQVCTSPSLPQPFICVNGAKKQRGFRIEYEFNDAAYVAELTWIPEKQFRPAADGSPIPPSDSASAAVWNVRKTMDRLAERRKFAIDKVAKAKADAKLQAETDTAAKRQVEEERVAAQRREREREQQRFLDMKQSLVAAPGITRERAMVWASEKTLPSSQGGTTDAAQCFGWVNYKIRDDTTGTVAFDAAPNALLQELGTPFLSNPVYNAAAGEWALQVASSACSYGIPIRIKAPGTEQAKGALLALKPGVVFQLTGETLAARTVQLFGPDGAVHTVSLNVPAPARFDMANARTFKARNEQARRGAQQAADAADAKLREHYWGQFVLAIKDTGTVCQSLKSQMLSMRAQGVQDWQLNQLARQHMADPSMRFCLVR